MKQVANSVSVQVRQEPKPCVNGDEKFALAVQGQRIASVSDLEPLKQVLRYCMALVGVRAQNLPDEANKAVLLHFIKNNYGGHTPEEIRLAFDMAVSGKLGLPLDQVKCYENFSPLYFSTIMNAYREWAKAEYVQLKPPEPVYDIVEINIGYAKWLQSEHFKKWNKLPVKVEAYR